MGQSNPNSPVTPTRKPNDGKLTKRYNADANDGPGALRKAIQKEFQYNILEGVDTFVSKVLTTPSRADLDTGASNPLRVRARTEILHDHLPIPQGSPGWKTPLERYNKCVVELHPEYTSFQKQRFSDIKEGSEILTSHYEPEVPYEYNNGKMEAVYVGGPMQVQGMMPSETFRVCASYIFPTSVQPAGGAAQAGSASPPSGPALSGMTAEQTKDHCNTIYSLGEYKEVTEFIDSGRSITGVNISSDCLAAIEELEGFLPTLLGKYDVGLDSIGFGSVVDPGTNHGRRRRQRLLKIVQKTKKTFTEANFAAKPKPWKNKMRADNNFTTITKADARELMKHDVIKLVETTIKNLKAFNPAAKISQTQWEALAIFGYNLGPGNMLKIVKSMAQGVPIESIYAKMLRYNKVRNSQTGQLERNAHLSKRRKFEAEWFVGNKNYKGI